MRPGWVKGCCVVLPWCPWAEWLNTASQSASSCVDSKLLNRLWSQTYSHNYTRESKSYVEPIRKTSPVMRDIKTPNLYFGTLYLTQAELHVGFLQHNYIVQNCIQATVFLSMHLTPTSQLLSWDVCVPLRREHSLPRLPVPNHKTTPISVLQLEITWERWSLLQRI